MSDEIVKALLALVIGGCVIWLFNGIVDDDDAPRGYAESFNEWQKRYYINENGRYYRICPPNNFEDYKQRKTRYRKYCYQKNRRKCNG